MDFIVDSPEYKWFDEIWVVVERLSKMQQFIPRYMTIAVPGLAELLLKEMVWLKGLPVMIVRTGDLNSPQHFVDSYAIA